MKFLWEREVQVLFRFETNTLSVFKIFLFLIFRQQQIKCFEYLMKVIIIFLFKFFDL